MIGQSAPIPILLVDDRPDNLLALEQILGEQGYELVRALSGNEALRLTLRQNFALILMDVQMPEMDGFETAELLRANSKTKDIPIIFITAGMKDLQFQFKGYDAGAVDYLAKPVEPLFLRSKVKVFAELYQQRHEIELHKIHLNDLVNLKTAELSRSAEELKATNMNLEQQRQALARSNADLQRFAEITAHHLQEPARRMATYAERLAQQLGEQLVDEEARLSLDFIGQQARRQKDLLRDVERYLAADQPRGEVKILDTHETVKIMLARMAVRIGKAGAEITLGNLPPARIDVPRLEDLFGAALDNALRYGRGEQSLRITIEGQRMGSQVRYSISDNGPGVKEEYREQVFGIFERLSSDNGNSGAGLAILRRIAESCGGRAWIEGAHGGGCCILFELPAGELP
jgi:CheY-like chemotaxis protein